MTTCPPAATGSATSLNSRVSGPPGAVDSNARISALPRDPGPARGEPGFEFRNRGILCQRQTDLVQPLHQALAAERIEGEGEAILKRRGDRQDRKSTRLNSSHKC